MSGACPHGVALICTPLRFVHLLFQILQGFVEFQIPGCLIEGFVHRLVELLLLHLYHGIHVCELKEEQSEE